MEEELIPKINIKEFKLSSHSWEDCQDHDCDFHKSQHDKTEIIKNKEKQMFSKKRYTHEDKSPRKNPIISKEKKVEIKEKKEIEKPKKSSLKEKSTNEENGEKKEVKKFVPVEREKNHRFSIENTSIGKNVEILHKHLTPFAGKIG